MREAVTPFVCPAPIHNGDNVKFVDKWLHLGHIISVMHDKKLKL